MKNKEIAFQCIKVTQPIGTFFIGNIGHKELCEITTVDIRRVEGEKGYETYMGIQRPRSEKRIKEIAKYVQTVDACFPTAVILAVDANCAFFNEKDNTLTLKPYENTENPELNIAYEEIAIIIDGQHRIFGGSGKSRRPLHGDGGISRMGGHG